MLVDAPGLWFRSFFGVPSSMRAPDGSPINAVRGFLDSLTYLVKNRRPDGLVCAVDLDWRPTWRVDLLPSYKAHRVAADGAEEAPDELGPQVEIILELMAAYGIPVAGSVGFEADDVLATLATGAGEAVEVVTGDRDLFQLVDDDAGVKVVYIGRGVAKAEVYDAAAVRAKYGVEPGQYADFAVLRGDPSDGLPGVKGIGEKTAAKLIGEYGNIPALVGAATSGAAGLTPRVRTALADAAEYLAAAPRVVEVVRDVETPKETGRLPMEPADPVALAAVGGHWGVTGPVRRLSEALALTVR